MTILAAAATVRFADARKLEELIPDGGVFSREERMHCAALPGLSRWAGRYAAKLALARLFAHLGAQPSDFEILPSRSLCPRQGPCDAGHPPVVALRRRGLGPVEASISISHDGGTAVAVAVVGSTS